MAWTGIGSQETGSSLGERSRRSGATSPTTISTRLRAAGISSKEKSRSVMAWVKIKCEGKSTIGFPLRDFEARRATGTPVANRGFSLSRDLQRPLTQKSCRSDRGWCLETWVLPETTDRVRPGEQGTQPAHSKFLSRDRVDSCIRNPNHRRPAGTGDRLERGARHRVLRSFVGRQTNKRSRCSRNDRQACARNYGSTIPTTLA